MSQHSIAAMVAVSCLLVLAQERPVVAGPGQQKAALETSKPLATLIKDLESVDANIRKAAQTELYPFCEAALFDPFPLDISAFSRSHATSFHHHFAPHATSIIKLLKSPDLETRTVAIYLLAAIGPEEKRSRQVFLELIRTMNPDQTWTNAALYLPYVCQPNEPVGPDLLKAYDTYAQTVAKQPAIAEQPAVQPATPAAKPSETADLPSANFTEEDLFWFSAANAAHIITQILIRTDRTQTELPSLLEATRAKYSRSVRAAALLTLANLQSEADAAIPTLHRLLNDPDTGIRKGAANAIVLIEGDLSSLKEICVALKMNDDDTARFKKSADEYFSRLKQEQPRTFDDFRWTLHFSLPVLIHGNSVQRRMTLRSIWQARPDLLHETLRMIVSIPRWITLPGARVPDVEPFLIGGDSPF